MTARQVQQNTPEYDDEEWQDYVPAKWSFRQNEKSNGIPKLFGLMLLGLAVLGIWTIATARLDSGLTLWDEFRHFTLRDNPTPFGGIDFGMSPADALRTRPDMLVATVAGGEMAGIYEWNGVRFTVGFGNMGENAKAYRFHSVRVVDAEGTEKFIKSMVSRYGSPVESDCGKRVFSLTRFCHFGWLTDGGIALNISTRPVADGDDDGSSEVTVIARDTFLDGKRRRVTALVRS